MTDIPDDVVEMAAAAYGDASGDHYDCLRSAGRVFVEWESERIAKKAEDFCFGTPIEEWVKMTKKEVSARALTEFAAAIRARGG
jgi:hypothetical protein